MPAALQPTCCCWSGMGWVASVVAVLTKRVLHLRLQMHRLLLL